MARRSLSYADAVRLLSSEDDELRAAFERVAGFLVDGGDPDGDAVLSLFEAKHDLLRLSRELVGKATGLRAPDEERTTRLEAAHTVIVVAAFFEELSAVRLPVEITRREQFLLVGADLSGIHDFAEQVQHVGQVVPSPVQEPESFRTDLRVYYLELVDRLHQFLSGLAEWDTLPASERKRITRELADTADHAHDRYQNLLTLLAVAAPEIRGWLEVQDHRDALAVLGQRWPRADAASTWAATRRRLTQIYGSAMRQPIVRLLSSLDQAECVSPTVEQAYVIPNFRTTVAGPATPVSDESWWKEQPVREDLLQFLAAYLTSSQAVSSPLLVTGHPGAGKSLLTQVLAARLPTSTFVPVRVALREVQPAISVAEQVERAILTTTAEHVRWSDLTLAAGDALPVLLLDGLDELIHTSGTHQHAYLEKVLRFQREQLTAGRPVAVVVTSRTITLSHISVPPNTTAVRLESFDESQVRSWLVNWNEANAEMFAHRGVPPLALDTVRAHGDFATQPLLLQMLALYHADDNLGQLRGSNAAAHLFHERLIRMFAAREAGKSSVGSTEHLLDVAVEREISTLSMAAFAMFNRGTQSITTADLEADLDALIGLSQSSQRRSGSLRAAERSLGSFYFVNHHRASAQGTSANTYEFLHATVGEYLVARLIWQVVGEAAARAKLGRHSFTRAPSEDDDLLATLLSYQPLSSRTPVLWFLDSLLKESPLSDQDNIRGLLLTLFQNVDHQRSADVWAHYRPRHASESARHATYAANLLLISLCTGEVSARELYPDSSNAVDAWRDLTLFWRSRLSTDGWHSLVDTVALKRVWNDERRDVRLTMRVRPQSYDVDLAWSLDITARDRPAVRANTPLADWMSRESHFQCGVADALMHHALEPLTALIPDAANTFTNGDDGIKSVAHLLLEVLANPSPGAYRAAAAIPTESWSSEKRTQFWNLLLRQLCTGARSSPEVAADVLVAFTKAVDVEGMRDLTDLVLRCVTIHLGLKREADEVLARMVDLMYAHDNDFADPVLAVDAAVRVYELGLPVGPALEVLRSGPALFLGRVARIRPDLAVRLQAMIDGRAP